MMAVVSFEMREIVLAKSLVQDFLYCFCESHFVFSLTVTTLQFQYKMETNSAAVMAEFTEQTTERTTTNGSMDIPAIGSQLHSLAKNYNVWRRNRELLNVERVEHEKKRQKAAQNSSAIIEHQETQQSTWSPSMHGSISAIQRDVAYILKSNMQLQNSNKMYKNRDIINECISLSARSHKPLWRYVKTENGLGPGIPGGRYVIPPHVQVGQEYPSPPFPDSYAGILTMTEENIQMLSMLMHHNFYIAEGDSENTQRWKLLCYIIHGI